MLKDNIFKTFDIFECINKFLPLLLYNFISNIVKKIFREMNHSLIKSITLKQSFLNIILLSRLVQKPSFTQHFFDLFTIKDVSEEYLVFSDSFFREY